MLPRRNELALRYRVSDKTADEQQLHTGRRIPNHIRIIRNHGIKIGNSIREITTHQNNERQTKNGSKKSEHDKPVRILLPGWSDAVVVSLMLRVAYRLLSRKATRLRGVCYGDSSGGASANQSTILTRIAACKHSQKLYVFFTMRLMT